MYKTFAFRDDDIFGKVARVEFSLPKEGDYAYLLGNFNSFNEGSFRMRERGGRWSITLELPEGVWYYAFSVDGIRTADPENPERSLYRRLSYKMEDEVSVASISSGETFYHHPSLTYLYSFGDRTYVRFRALKGKARRVYFVSEKRVEMKKKATDELFDYFEAVLPRKDELEYHFEILTGGGTLEYGDFRACPSEYQFPQWVLDRVFYQIMPDRFARGGWKNMEDAGGDLWGIMEKIEHLRKLGINAIYLTPLFESTSYHGYDVTDYYRVGRRLGGESAFENLLRELKKNDIKLLLDGVFHHTSFFHPYFQDVIRKGEGSRYRDFYRVIKFPVVSAEFLDVLKSPGSWKEKREKLKKLGWNYESFFSVWLMPRLNHDNPEVREFIADVMKHWLDRGADGWRLDVAHGVPPELWREIRKKLPEEAYLIGEVMDDARLWIFDKFHGTMNYPLYEAFLRFFVYREMKAEEFLNWIELLSAYYGPAEFLMYNFLDNHDVERFLGLVGSRERYLCALAFLMTYKGIPSIYYGDEVGLDNVGGSPMERSRAVMDWNPEEWDGGILEVTKELIKLRRNSKALQMGAFRPLIFRGGLLLYERTLRNERIIVGINYSETKQHTELSTSYEILLGHLDNNKLSPWSFFIARELH
ncbi:alpha amylase N-terminal ig-like domain-containing protein [Thermococcus sp.]